MSKILEETVRFTENSFTQFLETFDIPLFDIGFIGIDVNREVKVVRHKFICLRAHLKNIESFNNENVWLLNRNCFTINDVVDNVAINRSFHIKCATFQITKECQQGLCVVALGETFTVHNSAIFKNRIRKQETIGGDEVNTWVLWPARKQRLQDSGEGTFTYGHTAGNPNDIRNFWRHRTKERC